MATELLDPFDRSLAMRAPEPLREFNVRGVLDAADVHVARLLGTLAGVDDGAVLLAAALAVRAPRMGHVFVDLATVAGSISVDDGAGSVADGVVAAPPLDWPEPSGWVAAVARCAELVATGGGAVGGSAGSAGSPESLPLRLVGSRLYLDRYWQEEQALGAALSARADVGLRQLELAELGDRIGRMFPDPEDRLQRAALACGALRGLTVIAGGPGTGKTTTVARLVALLCDQADADDSAAPLIALCAPTGKAAARMGEVIQDAGGSLEIGATASAAMRTLSASTIHRLLGWMPGGRFRYSEGNRLPHDVVIVDETSMVPLSLMVRLVGAVRPDAQLVLVGDHDQLTAIEAGAVLRDIVGPAAAGVRFGVGMRSILRRATGISWDQDRDGGSSGGSGGTGTVAQGRFGDGVVMLRRGHRFGASIGAVAEAIRSGDADAAVDGLLATATGSADSLEWIRDGVDERGQAVDSVLARLRAEAVRAYGAVHDAARAGDAVGALSTLGSFRLLCAQNRGPYGIKRWTTTVEQWLLDDRGFGDEPGGDQVGRPLLITKNDHELRLNNGDTGVIVEGQGAVFERDGELVGFAPSRLGDVEALYAMTVHKSQGSQFDVAAVILPEPDSPTLTRELLYTAVTRARRSLIVVGSEDAVRAAVQRPVARATGLGDLLWS